MKGESDPKNEAAPDGPDLPEDMQSQEITEADIIDEFYHRLALAPDNNELRLHLARWLARHGHRREALEELRVLVRLDPNHLVARKLREELLRESGESDPGVQAAERASEALH